MDLNTIEHVICPRARAAIPAVGPGDAYLAGGTWLFSEPQTHLNRLVDLTSLLWPPLERNETGLAIAATCTLATLEAFEPPAAWHAARLIRQCCRALLGSFKIRRAATIGGNLCLALPAAPMAALAVALQGICVIWSPNGTEYLLPARDFIIGAQKTALRHGEILRAVCVAESALCRRAAFRQISLTPLGRSAALLIGTRDGDRIDLTITAAVANPVSLTVPTGLAQTKLNAMIDQAVPAWYDDVHGRPAWRRRITHVMAADICAELTSS
jgi:CO/xanthine dehydrogenase FAD-binding subunit